LHKPQRTPRAQRVETTRERRQETGDRRQETEDRLAAEIAESGEEPWGVEITGCLAGEGVIYWMKAVLEIGKETC